MSNEQRREYQVTLRVDRFGWVQKLPLFLQPFFLRQVGSMGSSMTFEEAQDLAAQQSAEHPLSREGEKRIHYIPELDDQYDRWS